MTVRLMPDLETYANLEQRCEAWLDRQRAAVDHRAPWAWASLPGIEDDDGDRGGTLVAGDGDSSYYWCDWLNSARRADHKAGGVILGLPSDWHNHTPDRGPQ